MNRSPLLGSIALSAALAAALASAAAARGGPAFTSPLVFTNEFFPFQAGAVKTFRGISHGERATVVEIQQPETRPFSWGPGVDTHVIRELEYEDGELVESSLSYYAQADDGTVYAFGEVVDEYEKGVVVGHAGSWLVGGAVLPSDPVDAASASSPAVAMPATLAVGQQFKPEDVAPVAEETVTVLALDKKVTVEAGKYTEVLYTVETSVSPDGAETEWKWYARGVGVVKSRLKGERLALIASTFAPPSAP
ncbi:MAG TPA: hypothetical protein VKE69_09100 [Planctomycetota bacterium]|nr:hypothetical protein [Planctomycetota bacterium]